MTDIRIEKLAELLVDYSVAVKPGDTVAIEGDAAAEPLLKAIYVKVLRAGGLPFLQMHPDGIMETLYCHASEDQLRHIPEATRIVAETYDVRIHVSGETNTKALSSVDPAKIAIRSSARRGLMETILARSAAGEMRWVTTNFPTPAYAQDAEMGLAEYEDFVYGACMPDLNDPVAYWQRFSAKQDRIIDCLSGKQKVRVLAPETELSLDISGRTFINCDGHLNMPDGEIFTGPVENSVNGTVYFSYPSIYDGHEVSGIRLTFRDGKVIKASAEKNQEFLLSKLDTDEGARYVGEFAIGTNEGIDRFTGEILFDEKINGSFHLALGTGYPESGSLNRSAIHWDMVCVMREGEIWVDDLLFYKDGKFLI